MTPLRSDWISSSPRVSSQDETWDGLWGSVDYETMLEADTDVILYLLGMTPRYDVGNLQEILASHSVGQELSAVKAFHAVFRPAKIIHLADIRVLKGRHDC